MEAFIFFALTIIILFGAAIKLESNRRKALRKRKELIISSGILDIDQMSGKNFENYLAVLFKRLGYQVEQTPSSGDFGADLILRGDGLIVVQAKRSKNKVGVRAVQEVNSARYHYQADKAYVITNNFFTAPAIKLAKSNDVVLLNRNILIELILMAQKEDSLPKEKVVVFRVEK